MSVPFSRAFLCHANVQAAFRLMVGNSLRVVCGADPIPCMPPAGIRCALLYLINWRSVTGLWAVDSMHISLSGLWQRPAKANPEHMMLSLRDKRGAEIEKLQQ